MDILVSDSSERSSSVRPASSSREATLASLWKSYNAQPIRLQRTRDGRSLSRERYRRSEEFMLSVAMEAPVDWPDFLYTTGIVVELALSSHLLDVGFADAWCARYVSLNIDRSLAYANASGFGLECAETTRLTSMLSPYWKWNRRHLGDRAYPKDGGFTFDQIRALLRVLMNHVGNVTGHALSRRRMRIS